jgi:methanogenic corrinoid protein MtbC1
MATLTPTEVVLCVFSPLLHEVGERWHRDETRRGQEHLLSASTERLLMAMIHQSQKMACGPSVVLGTLGGERHALGSLLAAFLALAHGIRCCYLGPPAGNGIGRSRGENRN